LINEPVLEISGKPDFRIQTDVLKTVLHHFCIITGIGNNIIVSLVFCTSEEMTKINTRYRGVSDTTDVLSFPSESQITSQNKLNKKRFLGEILVDTNYIFAQADKIEKDHEISRIFIHGLLHLIDYDHLNTNQKNEMQEFENKILESIKQDGISE